MGAEGVDEQAASARLDRTAAIREAVDLTAHYLDMTLNDAIFPRPLLRILGLSSGNPGSE